MKNMKFVLIAIIAVIVIAGVSAVSTYNGLVTSEENVNNKWAQVDNQLKRRADLIPNLVNTVKGYAKHEEDILTSVSEARSKLIGAKTTSETIDADNELSGALNRLLAITESYPDLKANENFRSLMDTLEGTENRISVARKDYNDEVTIYNKQIKTFPKNMFANMFGFDQKTYFEVTNADKENPEVNFE